MRKYTQLTHIQRYQISVLLKIGHSKIGIAQTIGVHKSTIVREIARNRGKRGYRPKQAHQFAIERRDKAKRRITTAAWEMIDQLIKLDWSPQQISDYLGKEQRLRISHEWIISISMRINAVAGHYGGISEAEKREENAMVAMKNGGRSPTGYGLMSGRWLWTSGIGLGIGKQIQSSAKASKK